MPRLTPYFSHPDNPSSLHLFYFYEQLSPGSPLPSFADCCEVRQRVTWRIENLQTTPWEELVRRFSQNKKRQFRKAENLLTDSGLSPSEFYDLHSSWLSGRGRTIEYDKTFFTGLAAAAVAHNSGQVIALHDKAGEFYAAAFVVWDNLVCYYLVPSFNPLYSDSGAGARLAVECIRFAKEKGCEVFDFEGGNNVEGVAEHYRQFGSAKTMYHSLEWCSSPVAKLLIKLYISVIRQS